MPHFTCSSCGIGLYSAARPADVIDARCPACGAPPRRGFARRRFDGAQSTAIPARRERRRPVSAGHARIVDRFDAFVARGHDTARAKADAERASRDADRWLDDSGSFVPTPVRGPTSELDPRPDAATRLEPRS